MYIGRAPENLRALGEYYAMLFRHRWADGEARAKAVARARRATVSSSGAHERAPLHFELRDEPLQRVFGAAGQRDEPHAELEAPAALGQFRRAQRNELEIERQCAMAVQ